MTCHSTRSNLICKALIAHVPKVPWPCGRATIPKLGLLQTRKTWSILKRRLHDGGGSSFGQDLDGLRPLKNVKRRPPGTLASCMQPQRQLSTYHIAICVLPQIVRSSRSPSSQKLPTQTPGTRSPWPPACPTIPSTEPTYPLPHRARPPQSTRRKQLP